MAAITQPRVEELQALCADMRKGVIKVLHKIQTGHAGGSLSCCEILTALYFELAQVDPQNPNWEGRDRIVLTKGHAAPMLYYVLAKKGFFPEEEIQTLRQINSRLQGHACAKSTPGVEVSSGPMGLGLPAAIGIALSLRLDKNPATVYALMGDGELNEGTVWEACMSASKFALDSLIAIVDYNKVQLDGTADEIMPMGDLGAKFAAFGFDVFTCDGHSLESICETVLAAKAAKGKPKVIIADTVKGKGVSFMEGKNTWHGAPIGKEDFERAMAEMGG